jgi:xanthine dehydrogenase accessory factor
MTPTEPRPNLVLVRGGGELASAAARLLFLSGFPVAVLEREQPLAVRRKVSFAEAVHAGTADVEGVPGRCVLLDQVSAALEARQFVPVVVDPEGLSLARLRPAVLVDARMAKRNLGTRLDDARLVIGLGPGFVAGQDVHAVVETQRGVDLGRVRWSGSAAADTMIPGNVQGYTDRRVLRAPRSGVFRAEKLIGEVVTPSARVGTVDGEPVTASIPGLLRGLVADGVAVEMGVKIGDIDPRGPLIDPTRISDKGRTVAAGVLEAVLIFFKQGGAAPHPLEPPLATRE